MEQAAIVISILALAISIIVAIVEGIRDYKITKISLEFEFYREIFKDHLIQKIPQKRSFIWIDEAGKLQDAQYLIEELNKIRHDSLYFLYNNKPFYEELKSKLQHLEDYLITMESEEIINEGYENFFVELQEQLDGIYKVISKAYQGKL